jgi:hypothetical protein
MAAAMSVAAMATCCCAGAVEAAIAPDKTNIEIDRRLFISAPVYCAS